MHLASLSLVLISAQLLTITNAANILGIFAFPGQGPYSFVEPLLKELAQRGHHVTSITNYPQSEPVENFRDIRIEKNQHLFDEFKNFSVETIEPNHYDVFGTFYTRTYEMCHNIFANEDVRKLRQTESFDLIIMDVLFTESFFGFGEEFGAPMVAISSWGTMSSVDELVGNITPLSYVPNMIMLRHYNQNMNFWRRCLNVAVYILEWIHYNYKYMSMQQKIYEQHFPNASKSITEAQKNFSLVLVNDHFVLSTPRPYVPNMIEVAGMHIPSKVEPLSEDIKEILDKAQQGIIYITINSFLPQHIFQMVLNVLGNFERLVLWNTQYHVLHTLQIPSNVYFSSNVSHHSMLSFANIHLLITHGEYLRIVESIHYGVPILSLPRFDGFNEDYVDNIRKIGNGISLTWEKMREKPLSKALNDLLATDRYRREAKSKSKQFRDQQNTPLERAIYWIEYVLRFQGAHHLRNLGQNLTIWEFYNLDVFLCLSLALIVFVLLSYISLNLMLKLIMNAK
ncbi:UDP-glucosyltransferase 2-like [Stomoxys calcitrans]|uniref:UDP-glucosyltransferase 2-like n=1 Tax=Stomoxys calcitrans TaxID=35570 RepID=UPI0027E29B10|nr:UDP-glucosyltransferase 2-like [Stomoxys calcitrans]